MNLYSIRPMRGLLPLVSLSLACVCRAQDFGITGDRVGTNFLIEYETRTDAYYRVHSATSLTNPVWTVRDFKLGDATTQEWNDVGVLIASTLGTRTQQEFYKVGRVWLTNSLDYDGDGLGDAYELTHPLVSPFDPDSDSDGATDGDEVNFFQTAPGSPYNGPAYYYGFDTNMQGWTNENWEYGRPVMGWTNVTGTGWTNVSGMPSPGCLAVFPPTGTGYAKVYVKDGAEIENRDARLRPLACAHVYIPSGAPLPPGDAIKVKFYLRSSSDGWSFSNCTDAILAQPGEWTHVVLSNINSVVLADADEWGVEVIWGDANERMGPVLIDTVCQLPILPPTNPPAPAITGVAPSAGSVGAYEKFELTIGLTNVVGFNPFDPTEINLEATFTSPTGGTWNMYGFYMEDPADAFGEGDWRIRFAPDTTGTWSYVVRVSNSYGTNSSSTSTFSCVTGSRHGWLRVAGEDPHYFRQDDGTPFIGIGYCHCWDADDEGLFANCEEHGINMLHWWMAPWDTMLTVDRANPEETWRERSTFYSFEQGRAAELDRIVGYAEQHNVKLVWTIWPHDAIRDFNYHKWRLNGSWQKAFDAKVSEPEWFVNAFSEIDSPAKNQKFFHDAKYRRYQENLYRYMIARWGYSEAIGLWALVSEMFGTFANSLNCAEYQSPTWVTNKSKLFGENPLLHMDRDQVDGKDHGIEWLNFINGYFKTNDPFRHPTTASYGTDEYWDGGFPVVDVTQIHTYSDLYNWITPPLTLNKYHRFLRAHYDKPSFMGEIGTVDWKYFEPDYLRVTAWPGICSGAAITPMMWTTPAFSWFGDAKMGPWLDNMSDEIKVLANFLEGVDFHRLGLGHADVETKAADEPAVTLVESFETGLNGWAKWGDGVTAIAQDAEHATEGSYSLLMNVNMDTYDSMPNPASGIQKYEGEGFSYNWTNYWPHGTLKMDVYIPEAYEPDSNPDGFLLGINKDPRSIIEIHCRDAATNWTYYSTTNEFRADGGWKKLTVGMPWNLELPLGVIPTEYQAAHIVGLKFWFGDVGILRGPVWIDNITAGRYAYNTMGMISSNKDFAFAWIQDRRWTNSLVSSNAAFKMNGLAAGSYNIEWWNTMTGPFASANADAPTGTLTVTVPPFLKDVAVKIRRMGSVGFTNHDIAVCSVSEYDWVVKGPTQRVAVLVMNRGSEIETFSVTLTNTTDGLAIGTNAMTLGAGAYSNIWFTWNNTNLADGVKTLTAKAGPVSGETGTADNQLAGLIKVVSTNPPWDSCNRLRRWKEDSNDTDARTLAVSTNYASEETHAFAFTHRSPSKMQAYFGYDQVYEDWSNKTAFVYDVYNADSSTNTEVLIRSHTNWLWYYSAPYGIGTGWNYNVTFPFTNSTWDEIYWGDVVTTNEEVVETNSVAFTNHNVTVTGREAMQQLFIKFTGYTNDGTVYIDNIRLLP